MVFRSCFASVSFYSRGFTLDHVSLIRDRNLGSTLLRKLPQLWFTTESRIYAFHLLSKYLERPLLTGGALFFPAAAANECDVIVKTQQQLVLFCAPLHGTVVVWQSVLSEEPRCLSSSHLNPEWFYISVGGGLMKLQWAFSVKTIIFASLVGLQELMGFFYYYFDNI